MCKEVDEILEEVIKERRNSGQRIVWEEGFREGFKIGYEISTCKIEGKSLDATIMRIKEKFSIPLEEAEEYVKRFW
jgi:flagellar biosynthesis/type III secretory pathway protein FliH